MTADEIRESREWMGKLLRSTANQEAWGAWDLEKLTLWTLVEIAAQLAEANELKRQEIALLRADRLSDPKCIAKTCGYYTHYLAFGPADLTHEGYHAAEKLAESHFKSCAWARADVCPACRRHELAVRA